MGASARFEGVTKHYGPTVALERLDLDLDAGEILTLLGPSGSGKSTALHILAGFSEPTDGEVFIDGRPVTRVPTEKRNVGMVFQGYALFPHLSVRDNVAFPLRMRGVGRSERLARADAALELVRLSALGDRRPDALSGGQKQRVALARALVFEPPLLLMDEPLGALDLKLREALAEEIRALQRRVGCTVLLVTHDQTEAFALSDRIAVLRAGRLEQVGRPAEVFDRPSTRFVAEFVGEANLLDARVTDREVVLGRAGLRTGAPAGLCNGWVGKAVLRPGQIRLASEAQEGDVRLAATVIDAGFRGERLRLETCLPGGDRLVVSLARRAEQAMPVEGSTLTLTFAPEALAFVPDSPE